jgi:hypothetical protein
MLDEQINHAARDLTDALPHGDLRARVVARIESRSRHRPRWGLVALSSTVAIALLILVMWSEHSQIPVSPPARVGAGAPASPARPELDAIRTAQAPSTGGTTTRGTRRDAGTARVRQTPAVPLPMADDPLPGPERIAIDSLRLPLLPPEEPVATEPIALERLEIRPIADETLDQ